MVFEYGFVIVIILDRVFVCDRGIIFFRVMRIKRNCIYVRVKKEVVENYFFKI